MKTFFSGFFCAITFIIALVSLPVAAANQRLGEVHFELSCASHIKEPFNQAVALLHSFEYDQARKIFEDILKRDPSCAMANWGVAMTYLQALWAPPTNEGFLRASTAITQAIKQPLLNAKEREYIAAVGRYFNNEWIDTKSGAGITPSNCHGSVVGASSHREKMIAYRNAMANMYQRYPNDIEVALFYSLALISLADPEDQAYSAQLKAGEILQAFVNTHSQHPGLAHYIIHAYDVPALASRALNAALSYAKIAPDSAHAQHMPSHVFQRLGMWKNSVISNLNSTASARDYANRVHIKGHWDEELHGLDYLVNAYMQIGDYEKVKKINNYVGRMKNFYPENFKVAYALSSIPSRYMLDQKNWKGAANLKLKHKDFPWESFPWERSILHFAKGYGAVRIGNVSQAKVQLKNLKILQKKLQAIKNEVLASRIETQQLKILAWIKLEEGQKNKAVEIMRKAAEIEWSAAIPTGAILPGYEMLGDMYLEVGDYKNAVYSYEKSLSREKNRRSAIKNIIIAFSALKKLEKVNEYQKILNDISENEMERDFGFIY